MDELRHECGVAAVYCFNPAIESSVRYGPGGPDQIHKLIPRMLLDLQNRGQLSAGMSSYNPARDQIIETYKEIGTVAEAFRMSHQKKYEAILNEHAGRAAIGHVRYATCGPATRSYAQPFERRHGCKWKWFAFSYNGNLANYEELKAEIESRHDHHLARDTDTEAIMHFLAHAIRGDNRRDLVDVFRELSKKFDGAYNIAYLDAMGEMIVLRDPLGMRPLCYAVDGGVFAAASESVALQNLGFQNIKSLPPGHLIRVRPGSWEVLPFASPAPTAHCFFEWIYFANVASTLDDQSVYLSRNRLGRELADQERKLDLVDLDPENTIVVPVPDTGKAAADAMAFALGLQSVEGLIRNRYVGRTFIESANRADKVKTKFTPLREVLAGKTVILVEDSIVRSTTLASLVRHVKEQGRAAEVHVRVACPPIVAPCFYGINMSTVQELFAPKHMRGAVPTLAEQTAMARALGADSLAYLPLDAVARCIGLPETQLCRACLTAHYPTPGGEKRYNLALVEAGDARVAHRGCSTPAVVGTQPAVVATATPADVPAAAGTGRPCRVS
ncbi:amidophosphoribosyltransferase [Fimbriiglobus ruber]|uniref:Amidophosphoribosyltransferase n=1 Tax=Fimbriiglobus ruber TaxID=1908690 RepID=A0A225DG73_9BACT|nr:amidophosphoribosyltransferase [Fimbriiglobus ruber]OWK38644.1 Amidophosphoribosyltransferase [Fimbriiglobus ruber]